VKQYPSDRLASCLVLQWSGVWEAPFTQH